MSSDSGRSQSADEERRLAALRAFAILDTPPEDAFDDITALAAYICKSPFALITLVDEDRQWFKSRVGWKTRETPRSVSFCAHAIGQDEVFVIADASRDPRFADNPAVTGEPHIRFYAGAPLVTREGDALGTLCILDDKPRRLHPDHQRALRVLSRHAMTLLELRRQRAELEDTRRVLEVESVLREKLERFAQLADHIDQVFWMTDPAKNEMLYVSPAFERVWGQDPATLYSNPQNWLQAIHSEDRKRVRAALPDQAAGTYREEYRIIRPDGDERWISDRAFPVRNEAGEVYRIVGVAVDITGRKRLEQHLRESEADKRAVWESALDAIFTMDHGGRITELNPAAERMFGYSRDRAIGQPLADLIIPPALRERHRRALDRYLRTGEASILDRRIDVPALRADGSEFPAELTVVAVRTGPHPSFVGTIRDITEARQARDAVLKERNLSDELINSLPGVFYLFDQSGRFLRWNRQFEEVTGYSADEIRTLHPTELFEGADRELIAERIGRVFAAGASDAEADLVAKDGRKSPYYFTGNLIEFDGQPCLIGMGVGMGALKQAEAERDRLFNLSPDLFCMAGFDGYFKQVNPAWESVLGYSRSELLARPYLEFVHPEDLERTRAEAERVAGNGSSTPFENRFRCKDGSYKWLSWTSVTVPEERLIYAVARDVTEQKEISIALRESEARYRGLVESARDGIFTLAPDGTITSANRAFNRSTGWSGDEWIGRPFSDLLHPEDRSRTTRLFESLMRGEAVAFPFIELRLAASGGGYIPMEITTTPQRMENRVVGLLGIARDVRERHRMEEQLRQIQRLDSIGRLAAGVAHDFNNLLTVQQGHLGLLMMNPDLPSPVVEDLQEIAAATDRAAALTRQLLMFSRGRSMERQFLNLNEVVTAFSNMLDRLVGETVEVEIDCDAQLAEVDADPSMMEQVLMNLVVNARDAMPEGGRIVIATRTVTLDESTVRRHAESRPGRFVCLSVSDTGCGIAPDVLDKIFEPFFTTRDVGEGTGLGLATVHGIVKQHDGWVEVESMPGAGSEFRVFVPAVERSAAGEESGAVRSLRGGSETVLVVEDEAALRRVVKTVLERYGYEVLIASDGVEALELWRERSDQIDLLLTDMVMPHGISGWDLAERLWAEQPDLKVVVMSGYDPHAHDHFRTGADRQFGYLQKPYELSDLVKVVRDCLDETL